MRKQSQTGGENTEIQADRDFRTTIHCLNMACCALDIKSGRNKNHGPASAVC
jgi:hypothetical protein